MAQHLECRFCLQGEESEAEPTAYDDQVVGEGKVEARRNDLVDTLISPCLCKGTSAFVHRKCLAKWMIQEGRRRKNRKCAVCKTNFVVDDQMEEVIKIVRKERERDPEYIKEKRMRRERRRQRRLQHEEHIRPLDLLNLINLVHIFFPWIVFVIVFFITGGRFNVSFSFAPFPLPDPVNHLPHQNVISPLLDEDKDYFEDPPLWTDNCIGVSAAPSALCRKSNARSVGRPGNPHTFASLVCYMFPFPGCYGRHQQQHKQKSEYQQ